MAGLVGVTTFSSSLNRLVSEPGRFGSNYSFVLGELTDRSAEELRTTYEGDPDIEDLMVLSDAAVHAGGTTIGLVGVEQSPR